MLLFTKAIKFSIVNKNQTKGTQPYINAKTGFQDAALFLCSFISEGVARVTFMICDE